MDMKAGFVIRISRGNADFYVRSIVQGSKGAEWVAWLTAKIEAAKAWKTPQGVRSAWARIGRKGEILVFRSGEEGRRVMGSLTVGPASGDGRGGDPSLRSG